jgi:K+-transporting ATPase KdpF subunit
MCGPASAREEAAMTWEYAVGLVLAALLLAYLVYAMLKPERF